MKSIFDITQDWIAVMSEIEENEGEITEDLEYKLEINESNLNEKAEAYTVMIEKYKSEADQIDNEIKRLQSLSKVKKNSAERLKQRLSDALEFMQVDKLDLGSFKIGWRKSTRLEILDNEQVEEEFRVHSWEPDKKRIAEELKSGARIAWAELQTHNNLQIK